MKALLRTMWVLALALAVITACSQKSGNEQQAAASGQEEAKQAAAEPEQPVEQPAAQVQSEQQMEQQAAQVQPEEQMATSVSNEQQMQEGAAAEQIQENVADAQLDTANAEEISGTVVRTDDGIALFSDSGSYMIAGQELGDLVGRNVKVTGTIDEGAEKPIITVISVSLID